MIVIRQGAFAVDGESLQADVMRFMAIIAFCLIAILALVRNVEAPAQTPTVVPEASPSAHLDSLPPVAAIPPTPRELPEEAPAPIAEAPQPMSPVPQPAPLRDIEPTPLPTIEPVRATPPPTRTAPTAPEQVVESPPPPEAPEPDDEGMSLRFASDGDFLRLLAKSEIELFAVDRAAHRSLRLSEGFAFAEASAPGQIYELMPETIPALVVDALPAPSDVASAFTWGVKLPPRIASRIRDFVASESSGVLVIDRFAEVRHVPN